MQIYANPLNPANLPANRDADTLKATVLNDNACVNL